MIKFNVTVTREITYEVSVDETKYNKDAQSDFESYMWPLPDTFDSDDPDITAAAGFAQALAEQSARLGVNEFLEGFGRCGTDAETVKIRNERTPETYVEGLYINEIDDSIESEIERVD